MLVPKSELKHGLYYAGECRNAGIARWDANKQVFIYWRYSMAGDSYTEEINHFEDDDGCDLFLPEAVTEPERDIPL
ncbi:hypothetical protein phiK7B1_115 [Pseudomonas phage phiK7B1]|nr:hypothetical protein phiK7B1_115 [Pseudomonas phage phiK7B1]